MKVSKKRVRVNRRKMSRLRNDLWIRYERDFDNEIRPILKMLPDKQMADGIKQSLRNYVIIRLVSLMECFFSNIARRMVDEQKLDVTSLVDHKSLQEVIEKGLTVGQLVATNFDFTNYSTISKFFSKLLQLDFFKTVQALDKRDRYWFVVGAISLDKNWSEFERMFELRNDIVHAMKNATLSNRAIRSLCDNTMNVMEAAIWICHPDFPHYDKELAERMRKEYGTNPVE